MLRRGGKGRSTRIEEGAEVAIGISDTSSQTRDECLFPLVRELKGMQIMIGVH